jgi:ferredoxin
MLVINPTECIDCGVCVPECPIDAIKPESPDLIESVEINQQIAKNAASPITKRKPALPDADLYKEEQNKYEKYIAKSF